MKIRKDEFAHAKTGKDTSVQINLTKYHNELKVRIVNVQGYYSIAQSELSAWNAISTRMNNLKSNKNSAVAVIGAMRKKAENNVIFYAARFEKLQDLRKEINAVSDRVDDALAFLEANAVIKSSYSTQEDSLGVIDFDFKSEQRAIQLLLHTADAFIEISQ